MTADLVIRILNWFDTIRTAHLASMPEHERLIAEYRIPQDLAADYRKRLFAVETAHELRRRRWQAVRDHCDQMSQELVALADLLEARRGRLFGRETDEAVLVNRLFDTLLLEVGRDGVGAIPTAVGK